MRYAVWNNKGGVGKSFLTFVLGTEVAQRKPDEHVVLVDLCPQANLSEIVLGGNGKGADTLEKILANEERKTVGGYLDSRIASPHQATGHETEYLLSAQAYNRELPKNLWIIAGDPSLEIQAQVTRAAPPLARGALAPKRAGLALHSGEAQLSHGDRQLVDAGRPASIGPLQALSERSAHRIWGERTVIGHRQRAASTSSASSSAE
jgi:hypothetical protein